MHKFIQPSKASVRDWLQQRQRNHVAPPDIAQIRRELGWELIVPISTADVNQGPADTTCPRRLDAFFPC